MMEWVPIALVAVASPLSLWLGISLKRKRDERIETSKRDLLMQFANHLPFHVSPSECVETFDVVNGKMSIEEAKSRCLATKAMFKRVLDEKAKAKKESRPVWPMSLSKTACPSIYLAFMAGHLSHMEALLSCGK